MTEPTCSTRHAHSPASVISLEVRDAGEILTLQRAAFVTEAAKYGDFQMPSLVQPLRSLIEELSSPSVRALGIREDGRLVASVRVRLLEDGSEDLGKLVVAPDRQGCGLGTLLLLVAERAFPHARRVRLFTGEHSTSQIALYRRVGYVETHRTSAGSYDLVHMVKDLPSTADQDDDRDD